MDPLTSLALVGTARQGEPKGASGAPVDAVLAGVDVPMERRVLLAAGARAAATMAARLPSKSVERDVGW